MHEKAFLRDILQPWREVHGGPLAGRPIFTPKTSAEGWLNPNTVAELFFVLSVV